ncbi:MAG TPA: hypothetical protein VFD72_07295 [Sphingobacteriaceae bacterium]|nr:hypothetical protein [Sphingobacteriaceae bacterium]
MRLFLLYIGIGLGCLTGWSEVAAQESRQQRFERIEAEKIAFITQQLSLTSQEAQRFFPLYNEYRKEMNAVLQASRGVDNRNRRDRSKMDELATETAILGIKKKYRERYTAIVGQARASRFFEVEREFREKLVQELRRRDGRRMH